MLVFVSYEHHLGPLVDLLPKLLKLFGLPTFRL